MRWQGFRLLMLLAAGLGGLSLGGARAQGAPKGEVVIATFDSGRITLGDMQRAVDNKLPQTQAEIARPGGRERFLAELIRYDLLVAEAERRGYGQHSAVRTATANAEIDQLQKTALAIDPGTLSAAEVAAFYQHELPKLSRPRLRRASQILVGTQDQARALIAKLRHVSRTDFAAAASEHSRDEATRRQGGELGFFDEQGRRAGNDGNGSIAHELAAAAFALKHEGDVNEQPIATADGFNVIMLTGEQPAVTKSLKQVEGELREELAAQKQAAALEALVQRLRAEHPAELHPEGLDSIVLDTNERSDIPQGFPAAPADPRAAPKLVKPDAY
jgi:peptidyl-prolyl cis-trans isomerase C